MNNIWFHYSFSYCVKCLFYSQVWSYSVFFPVCYWLSYLAFVILIKIPPKNLFACVTDVVLLTLSSVSSSSSSSSLSSLLLLLTEAVSMDAVLSVMSELTSTWASAATCCQNHSNTRLDASSDLVFKIWSQSDPYLLIIWSLWALLWACSSYNILRDHTQWNEISYWNTFLFCFW